MTAGLCAGACEAEGGLYWAPVLGGRGGGLRRLDEQGSLRPVRTSLDYLPEAKRRELERIVEILFAEFEDATKNKQIATRKMGRILKIVLFGSYALFPG